MTLTETEKLEKGIDVYVKNWHEGLIKSWRTKFNKKCLKNSYEYVAKQAVKAYIEEQRSV